MHGETHAWGQQVLKKPKKRLRKAQLDLELLMRGPMPPEAEEERNDLAKLFDILLKWEEIEWSQRP
jgi:hypothetical protein